MVNCDVTRRALTLGSLDSVSGQYAKTYAASTIKMVLRMKGSNHAYDKLGFKEVYDVTGYTNSVIHTGDQIIDAFGDYYYVKTVQPDGVGDSFSHYVCELIRRFDSDDRPATYGTASSTTDPRTTVKTLLDSNINSSALTKDDGSTQATWITCFSFADYPVTRVLLPSYKNVDAAYVLGQVSDVPVMSNGVAVGYHQILPVTVYTMNKSGVTAENLLHKAVAELQHVVEAHGLGSLRITSTQTAPPDLHGIVNKEYIVSIPRELNVTLRTMSLGAADATTGWYAKSYATSTIQMSFMPAGFAPKPTAAGSYVQHDVVGVTLDAVLEGDQILHNSVYYEVVAVTVHPVLSLTSTTSPFNYYFCSLTKLPLYADRAGTSGTWHLDSDSVKTDPRSKIKTVIDTYLTATNIKKDDGSTNASTLTCFDGADYPISRVFLAGNKNIDAAAVISRQTSTPLYTDKLLGHKPYAFEEQVKIEVYAVNKSGVTAVNLVEQFEQEIRRIFTAYDAYSNVRDLDVITPSMTDLSGGALYHTALMVEYKRSNDDYTAALPTITYGDTQASTYYFPNATDIQLRDPDTGDIILAPPGRGGGILQILGAADIEIQITCDLDIDASGNKRWKRPQTAGAITDTMKFQVFTDIKWGHKTDSDQVFQNLNWGGGTTLPVRLINIDIAGPMLTLTFRRYTSSDASSGTAKAWYGIGNV